jgi:hypothetical protein
MEQVYDGGSIRLNIIKYVLPNTDHVHPVHKFKIKPETPLHAEEFSIGFHIPPLIHSPARQALRHWSSSGDPARIRV